MPAATPTTVIPAAFSRRIKSLEAWLGFDLIDRSVYPTQLTPQGERFREHAGELLRQMLDSRLELGGKPDLYECVTLGTEFLRPYASEALVAKGGASLPGRASHPVPLLMYSPGVYFARLVDLILENAPISGVRVIESDMSDVLCGMALGGRGIAWLTEGTVAAYGRKRLTPIGGDKWALPLSLVAFRGRMHDGQRALNLFWSELCRYGAGHAGAVRKR